MPRKPLYAAFCAALLITLTACASLGLETPKTLNERMAYVQSSADGLVVATTNALNAHTISSKDAEYVSASAKQLQGLVSAVSSDPDPATAEGRLKLAEGVLIQLQTYVASHGAQK